MGKKILFFGLLGSLAANTLLAQHMLGPEDPDYYLVQAFAATDHGQRQALYHVGIQAAAETQGWRLTAVLNAYPAQLAGLQAGDVIVSAGGEAFHPVRSFNAVLPPPSQSTGPADPIELEVLRDGETLQITVQPVFENLYDSYRSATLASSQQFPFGNKTVGYLRLWGLSRSSADLLALRELFNDMRLTDGLIIDLRGSYGFFDLAQLDLLRGGRNDLFELEQAEGWLSSALRDRQLPAYEAYGKPVALLIDGDTRAGAELLAYQLDKLRRVISLGDTTAGRLGYYTRSDQQAAQYSYQAADRSRIDGQALEGQGHAPERPYAEARQRDGRTDPLFQFALEFLAGII